MKYIRKWLTEFRSLPESASIKYFETMKFTNELSEELYNMFNNLDSDKTCQLIDPVCHQLFNCYKSNVSSLRNFALEFIPSIVWSYFTLLKSFKQQKGGITAFLLGIYNLGSNENSGSCIPSVFQASIYHDPPFMSTTLLTESALKNRHNGQTTISTEMPPKKFDSITSQNRSTILGFAIKMYLMNISLMSFRSRKNLCSLCSKLSRYGFEDKNDAISPIASETGKRFAIIHEDSNENLRSPFEPQLVVELLCGMQFLMFNGLSRHAVQAIQDVHFRASYDIQPEIIMVTGALLNFSNTHGINIHDETTNLTLTPGHSFKTHPISKDAITNASFRARKLPDDIDVREICEQPSQSDAQLLNGEPLDDQPTDTEKSPQGKVGKPPQGRSAQKKEKGFKLQKSKENEPSVAFKKSSIGGVHNSEVDAIQLKAVRQNSQDHSNINDVKSKSNKLPYSGEKNPLTSTPSSSSTNQNPGMESSNEMCSPTINLLSQSTFL